MNRQDRAKQFMPFAALKGYEEALRAKELATEPRIQLAEDEAELLDRRLRGFSRGSCVRIKHYRRRCYVWTEGVVTRIAAVERKLVIGKEEIKYDDIVDAELL